MKRYEYDITKHSEGEFEKIIYFCSATGECSLDDVSDSAIESLKRMFNYRGDQGWELIQFSSGKEGLLAFWKRKIE
jgi:hypothetical protein